MKNWKPLASTLLAAALIVTAVPITAIAAKKPPVSTGYGNAKVTPRTTAYYTGDYKVSLNLYSFNLNLNAWLKSSTKPKPPKIDTMAAIKFAKYAGFDAVDVTEYYIPGYSNTEMPNAATQVSILKYARDIKAYAKSIGIEISGTGAQNNFADPDNARRALDLQRYKFWIDVAAEMGAPVIRVFSGPVPADINPSGWEKITKDRIIPPLKELAQYGATKGVKLALQNHGDMTATADQIIQIIKWVNDPNIGIIDDTGYFRDFGSTNATNYNWYNDISYVLPYTFNFQIKKKPAGAETTTLMDLDRLLTDVRSSDYRGYLPVELLWLPGDPGYPKDLSTPPTAEIKSFFDKVKLSLQKTKTSGLIGAANLTGTAGTKSAVLTWTASPNATAGYFVKRKNVNNTYTLVGTVSATTRTFTESNLITDQSYTYVVTGYDAEREYAESNEVIVKAQ